MKQSRDWFLISPSNLPMQSYFFKSFTCVTAAAAQSNLGKKATLAFANVIH